MPYSLEVNDVITYSVQGMDPWAYADVLKRQFDQLLVEGEGSGTVMCVPLHAYLVSQPHRIRPFEAALKHFAENAEHVWFTTGVEIAGYFRENCWDDTVADMEARGLATGGTGFCEAAE